MRQVKVELPDNLFDEAAQKEIKALKAKIRKLERENHSLQSEIDRYERRKNDLKEAERVYRDFRDNIKEIFNLVDYDDDF